MAFVVTNAGQLICPHGGIGSLAQMGSSSAILVGIGRALTIRDVGPCPFGCPFISPCISIVSWIPGQQSLSLMAASVLTDTAIPVTNNGPGRVLNPGQTMLSVT